MEYAILLHLDKESEERVYRLWDEARSCGGDSHLADSGLRPHITLALFHDTDIDKFCSKLELFSKQMRRLSLKLSSIGTFAGGQGVIYLAPVVTEELLKLHKELYTFFDGELEGLNSYYMPGNWTPHCSISTDNSTDISTCIIKRIAEVFQPLEVEISEISITEFEPATRYIRSFKIV